ncbi:MAG: hypothetical protein HC918_05525 [Oscillatoriales cyanobacterium SM2_1_8]|nr:hypothetical protein [Oscillatoriales cyanobacterium SM2_1_8]
MYRKTTKDPVAAAVTAALGAGTVAGYCVSRGKTCWWASASRRWRRFWLCWWIG